MQFTKNNLILRLHESIVLTIYKSSIDRVHATGIKHMKCIQMIKQLFQMCQIKVKRLVINNSYWLKKPIRIRRFSEFASFCKRVQKKGKLQFDVSNFALNSDGFLNSIYMRHPEASGTIIIHRKSVTLLGAKCSKSVKLLSSELHDILKQYESVIGTWG